MSKTKTQPVTVSKRLSPEDIRVGDFVAVSRAICQLIPDRVAAGWDPSPRTVNVPYIPCDSGEPVRVVGVCLPFVLCRTPAGGHETIDVRRQSLSRLSSSYGKKAFKVMKPIPDPPRSDKARKSVKKNKRKK